MRGLKDTTKNTAWPKRHSVKYDHRKMIKEARKMGIFLSLSLQKLAKEEKDRLVMLKSEISIIYLSNHLSILVSHRELSILIIITIPSKPHAPDSNLQADLHLPLPCSCQSNGSGPLLQ